MLVALRAGCAGRSRIDVCEMSSSELTGLEVQPGQLLNVAENLAICTRVKEYPDIIVRSRLGPDWVRVWILRFVSNADIVNI